jgi:hypothetical protein
MDPTAEPRDSRSGGPAPRTAPPTTRPRGSVTLAGLWTFLVSAALVLSPLALGRSDLNRYLVAFGFVGVCVGLSIMLHGLFDWLRRGSNGNDR